VYTGRGRATGRMALRRWRPHSALRKNPAGGGADEGMVEIGFNAMLSTATGKKLRHLNAEFRQRLHAGHRPE